MAEFLSPAKTDKGLGPDEVGVALHEAAVRGEKRKLKRLLKKGIAVDYPNSTGQTALFCACFEAQEGIVDVLLKHGASTNERSEEGSTPCHAAAFGGNTRILCKLVEAGGDLRLHDNKSRTVRDWAQCHADPKRRKKMMEYIEKTRFFAMSHSGRDLLLERQSSHFLATARDTSSVGSLLRPRSSHKSLTISPSVHSLGYGKIYFGEGDYVGTMAAITLVPECALRHDEYGVTCNNGPFMVMESMQWNKTLVTVKRLHKEPPEGGQVDLLITENEYMAKLRHPTILLLMGICQTNNLEGLVLLYERVLCGSLYTHLYQRVEHLEVASVCEFIRQIADAVIYLHQQNLLHCAITSHAVQLVNPSLAKLSNFEYMVENVYVEGRGPKSKVVENTYLNATYNWMAPEVMADSYPTEKSDLYSLCAVMWETLHGMPPWSGMQAQDIKSQMVDHQVGIDISEKVKNPFKAMLQFGLSVEPKGRQLSLEQLRDVMAQIVVDRDALQDRVTSSPRPYRTWKHAANDVSQDVSSTCDDTSETEAISDVHRAQQSSRENSFQRQQARTKTYSSAKYAIHRYDQTAVKVLPTPDEEAMPGGFAKDTSPKVERVDISDLQGSPPAGSERFQSARREEDNSRATAERSDEFSFMSNTAKRSFFQSTPTSAVPATEAAVIQKSDSEGDREAEEDGERENQARSENATSSSSSSSTTICSQPEQVIEVQDISNPFKRMHVSNREIRKLVNNPPQAAASSTGGSSATLLAKQSNLSDSTKKPTVYSVLRQLSQENYLFPKTSSTIEGSGGSAYKRINYGHFSVSDLKNGLPAALYSPQPAQVKRSVTEAPDLAKDHNKSAASMGSHTSWVGDSVVDSPNTSFVKPASHSSPDRGTSKSRLTHFAFPPVPAQLGAGIQATGSETFKPSHFKKTTSPLPYYKRWHQKTVASGQQSVPTFRSETAVHQQRVEHPIRVQQVSRQYTTPAVARTADTTDASQHSSSSQPLIPDCSSYQPPASPRQEPEAWYGGKGSIHGLINTFQGQVEEHKKKQAILCLNSKRDNEDLKWGWSAEALGLSSPKRNAYNAQRLIDMTDARVLRCMEGPHARYPPAAVHSLFNSAEKDAELESTNKLKAEVQTRVGPAPMNAPPQIRRDVEMCPGSGRKIYVARHYSDTDQSETDKEVSELVNNVIRNVHQDVTTKYAHPDCPHRMTSNTAAGQSHVTSGIGSGAERPPQQQTSKIYRSTISVPSSTSVRASASHLSSHNSSHAYESINDSQLSSRSTYEERKGGAEPAGPGPSTSYLSNKSQQTWSSGYEVVGSPRSTSGRELDEFSETSSRKTTDNEIEEFYFDDVIRPEMLRDKHMRLQSTMTPDSQTPEPAAERAELATPQTVTRTVKPVRSSSSSSSSGTPVNESVITYIKVKRDIKFPHAECLYESGELKSDTSGQTVVEATQHSSPNSTPCISEGEVVYPTTSQSAMTNVTPEGETSSGHSEAYV